MHLVNNNYSNNNNNKKMKYKLNKYRRFRTE